MIPLLRIILVDSSPIAYKLANGSMKAVELVERSDSGGPRPVAAAVGRAG
jgi:hypothetical protein